MSAKKKTKPKASKTAQAKSTRAKSVGVARKGKRVAAVAAKKAVKKAVKKAAKPARKGKANAKTQAQAKAKAPAKAKAQAQAVKAKAPAARAKALTPRRDATGHLDPKYAKELRRQSREFATPKDDDHAFLNGPRSGDDLAEDLGEEFVSQATSGEDDSQDRAQAEVAEDVGGPFVESSGGTEFASGTDASNPEDAKREPFPTT